MVPTTKGNTNKYAPGFSPLSLPFSLLKGIHLMGYNQPTPIQKECIPVLNAGKDVVAMARTGSGKTAAFVIPLLTKLNCTHSARIGTRALVIAPTRELASQIHTFVESLCKKAHISLRSACVLGGDSISEQFSMLMLNPDILVGTPGRLLHLLAEVSRSSKDGSMGENFFSALQFVVLDEADRLFEDATSSAQISLLFSRFPASKQVALFSATMPSQLLAFSKTGLKSASLIRLDMEAQLSKDLKVAEKPALLLALLEKKGLPFFDLSDSSKLGGIIFVSTRHVANFLSGIFTQANIKHGVLFGQMDAEARKIIVSSFRANQVQLLIVTDVASRGIDIPSLQFVINYDFPAMPKLFVHRVGRVARAGYSGTAISLVSLDERPYFMDLEAFLGMSKLVLMRLFPLGDPSIEDVKMRINGYISSNAELEPLARVAHQSLLKYQRTRPKASPASYAKAKGIPGRELLPIYFGAGPFQPADEGNSSFLAELAAFRPSETVFEAMRKGSKGQRSLLNAPELSSIAALRNKKKAVKLAISCEHKSSAVEDANHRDESASMFMDLSFKDEKTFVNYAKDGIEYERGLHVAGFSLPGDEQNSAPPSASGKKRLTIQWDNKKKKFIQRESAALPETILEKTLFGTGPSPSKNHPKQKMVGDVYRSWKKTTHQEIPRVGSMETPGSSSNCAMKKPPIFRGKRRSRGGAKCMGRPMKKPSGIKSELKSPDQIVKARTKKANIAERLASKREKTKKGGAFKAHH